MGVEKDYCKECIFNVENIDIFNNAHICGILMYMPHLYSSIEAEEKKQANQIGLSSYKNSHGLVYVREVKKCKAFQPRP